MRGAASLQHIQPALRLVFHGAVTLQMLGQHPHEYGNFAVNVIVHTYLVFAGAGPV